MARIKVKLNDGRIGTINQEDFNPDTMTRQYNLAQKAVMSKSLPYWTGLIGGAAAAPVTGGLGSIPAAGLVGGATYSAQNLLRPYVGLEQKTPEESLKEAGGAVATGATARAIDMLTGKVANKVLSPTLRKVKGLVPETIKKSAKEVATNTWDKVINLLDTNAGQAKSISSRQVTSVLNDMMVDYYKTGNVSALNQLDKIDNMVSSLGKNISPEQAILLSKQFKEAYKLFSPTTGTLTKAIGQSASKLGATKVASELSSQAKNLIPGLSGELANYGEASALAKSMSNPTAGGLWKAALGSLVGNVVAPGLGTPIGVGAAGLSMPYTNFLLRKASYPLIKSIPYLGGGLTELLGGNQ